MQDTYKFPLPPGHDADTTSRARLGRFDLLNKQSEYGPVFSIKRKGQLTVYIIGLERCRRLLSEHADAIRTVSMSLTKLFPDGFLRKLNGDLHARLRTALTQSLKPEILENIREDMAQVTLKSLEHYSTLPVDDTHQSTQFVTSLNTIATTMLLQVFFGAKQAEPFFHDLKKCFDEMGLDGLVWTPGPDQEAAFIKIRQLLLNRVKSNGSDTSINADGNILESIAAGGKLSETMLGNLIYMVEMGRFDIYSLFRWMAKYGCDFPQAMKAIAEAGKQHHPLNNPNAESFVRETLRMDQSEKLIRQATREFVFEGYRIPVNATVQLCLWESHKDPDSFDNPLEFNPDRFLENKFSSDQYSPFGLGLHHCPMAQFSLAMGKIFIATLASNYTMTGINNDNPARGLYHWQPSPNFSVRMHKNVYV